MAKNPLFGGDPASFENEEFTTAEVRGMASGEQQEGQRAVQRKRNSGQSVQNTQRPTRGHQTPARVARKIQTPERENPVVWKPIESLDAPPANPSMVQRWVRYRINDKDDAKNLSKKFRTGWKPRLAKDVPDGYVPPETFKAQFGEVIAVGDLILCEMPRKLFQARKTYFRNLINRQKQAVRDKARAEIDPDHPMQFTEKDTFSRGNGRRPVVQDDE